jgi:Family of unknown function (DUF6088)
MDPPPAREIMTDHRYRSRVVVHERPQDSSQPRGSRAERASKTATNPQVDQDLAGQLRRIDRGLYDTPRVNPLTKKPAVPDYRQIIDAVARRDQVRMLVDGLTAANDLGLTTAVPSHVVIHTDARRRSIQLDKLKIDFKHTAPSKLYWAGRPAMRVVQALHWLKDTLPSDRDRVLARLSSILADPKHGKAIRDDLRQGISTLPSWMQAVVREVLDQSTDRPRSRRRQGAPPARSRAKHREAPRP